MSDAELRELERIYASGDPSVYHRLLALRFRIDPTVENAEAIFLDFANRPQGRTIDLGDSYARIVLNESLPGVRQRFGWINQSSIKVDGLSLVEPRVRFMRLDDSEDNSLSIVRALKEDYDLNKAVEDAHSKTRRAIEVANAFASEGILTHRLNTFLNTITTSLTSYLSKVDAIRAERNVLRDGISDYLQLVDVYGAEQAGVEWYKNKCKEYTEKTGIKVLSPEDVVIYYNAPPDGDQGVYAPDCYFPFYDFLNDEYNSYVPRANFLAAISERDSDDWHEEWEDEIKEEELEQFLEERAASYDVDIEDYKEKYYDYDDDRDFDRYFEEDLLPKRKAELIQQVVDETVDTILQESVDTSPEMSIAAMWAQLAEGYAGDVEVYYETYHWLDDELQSEVSSVVNETFEHWDTRKGRVPTPRVTPLDQITKRYYNRKASEYTPWYELNTTTVCSKPPMIKVDTRAIGWRAAFGIEPLVI